MVTNAAATGYSNQRKLDRCQNGNLVSFFSDTGTNGTFRVSTDGGVTWTNPAIDIAGVANGSIFIDLDDYLHVVWKQSGTGGSRTDGYIYYMRGTPNAGRTSWTWSAAVALATDINYNYPDIIGHRDPAGSGGWFAHYVFTYNNGNNNWTYYAYVNITSAGTITTNNGGAIIGGGYSVGVSTFPSIDFNHTGDGKTVAGSTPHLYVAWSAGKTGAGFGIRFRKAVYSAGSWTWNTEREIDNTRYIVDVSYWLNCVFDGTRAMIVGMAYSGSPDLVMHERDAADTTTTTRSSASTFTGNGSASYDSAGNIYFFGADTGNRDTLVLRKWVRSTVTLSSSVPLGPIGTPPNAATSGPWVSAKRGYSNGRIEWVYTSGNNSPYAVKYDYLSVIQQGSATALFQSVTSVDGTKTQYGSDTATIQTATAVAGSLGTFGAAQALFSSNASATGLRIVSSGSVVITIKSRLSANWTPISLWNPMPVVSDIWSPVGANEITWDR